MYEYVPVKRGEPRFFERQGLTFVGWTVRCSLRWKRHADYSSVLSCNMSRSFSLFFFPLFPSVMFLSIKPHANRLGRKWLERIVAVKLWRLLFSSFPLCRGLFLLFFSFYGENDYPSSDKKFSELSTTWRRVANCCFEGVLSVNLHTTLNYCYIKYNSNEFLSLILSDHVTNRQRCVTNKKNATIWIVVTGLYHIIRYWSYFIVQFYNNCYI